MTGNRNDGEADIVLVSAKDGSVIRNLTKGFDQKYGFEFIVTPGGRWNTVPWLSWAQGDQLAYFVRTEKSRTLILQNVLTRDIEERYEMRTLDEPESPDVSPDGKKVVFSALRGRHERHLRDRPRHARDHQPHQGRVRRRRADVVARRAVHRLHGADQRQREAVPPGHRLGHARRS